MPEEDVLFGKNRHLFGGLAPSNMRKFDAYVDRTANKVRIEAQLPYNTVVNNQTLCTVAGAVIRRKAASFPVDEFDGDYVATITQDVSFIDENTTGSGVYFYSAFPFTTQGVYNRNKINRVNIGAPDAIVSFYAESHYDPANEQASVILSYELPENADGALIRRSVVEYPVMESDGDFVADVESSGSYTDSGVTPDITYFYTIFPYRGEDLYNYDESNRLTITVHMYEYFYGFDIDISNPDPATRVTYPEEADNYGFTPAKMVYNGNNSSFNYGSWSNIPGDKFMPRPCVLGLDGTVLFYLNPNDYFKKADGTSSGIGNKTLQGDVMVEWPKIYTKRWEENGVYHFRCSDTKIDSGYECWANYDKNNNEIDHFYTSVYPVAFPGYTEEPVDGRDPEGVDYGRFKSLSGHYPEKFGKTLSSTTMERIRRDKVNPETWNTEILVDRLLINDLLILMAKSTNLSGSYGTVTRNEDYRSGEFNTKGLFYRTKVFGMENWYNDRDHLLSGWYYDGGVQKVKVTQGTKDGSSVSDYGLNDVTGYISVSNSGLTGSGYLKNCLILPYGRLPKTLDGSASTFETSNVYYNSSGKNRASVGSSKPFDVALTNITTAVYYIFLSCKPLSTS